MDVTQTALPGVVLLKPRRFGDDRGFFSETWNRRAMAEHGLDYDFVQDNQSLSDAQGPLRGLHDQSHPHAQGKRVRCTRGCIVDVAVDIRVGSPTYGQWVGYELTPENGLQLMIPAGFLHGFVTRTSSCEVQYKCTDYYAPECDGAVHWDSAGIDWGEVSNPVLSEKDKNAVPLAEFESPFVWTDPA